MAESRRPGALITGAGRLNSIGAGIAKRLADDGWDILLAVLHGGVNRAILSRAVTGGRTFLGGFEQSPGCINVLDAAADGTFVVRAVNHTPYDPVHARAPRLTTMEQLWLDYLDARDENP